MRIRVLGSAAAEGWPALFCECEGCKKARANGGKDLRRRTAYLIDDDTLVDIGPDVYSATLEYGIDSAKITRLLITHSHTDHLTPRELCWRRKGFSKVELCMDIFGNEAYINRICGETPGKYTEETPGKNPEAHHISLHKVLPGDTFTTGDMTVTAILADHAIPPELPLNYIVQRGGVTAFIGNDSGWWCEESWNTLAKFKIDIAIIECTYGLKWPEQSQKHMGSATSVRARDELRRIGALKDDAIVIVNHFSHNCQNLHNEMEQYFCPKGILVGYDGMILEK